MATIQEIRAIIEQVLDEAKKKKAKAKDQKGVQPIGFSYVEAYDYSQPLGVYNLYKSQGAANFGPFTGVGPSIVDGHIDAKFGASEQKVGNVNEDFLRAFVRQVIREAVDPRDSAWTPISEQLKVPQNGWEVAIREHKKKRG